MAKKGHRRVGAESEQRRTKGSEPPIRRDKKIDSADSRAKQNRKLIVIFVVFFIIAPFICMVVYRKRYSSYTDMDPALPYVYQRCLVKAEMDYGEVLTENMKFSENTTRRHFTNSVLAYITPWNSRGFDVAKRFNFKFTHVSPVWYDLKSQGTTLVLEGRHNADSVWISELRMKGETQVIPRVVLEATPVNLLRKKKQRDKAIELIITECKEMEYDGIVLESWSRWAAYGVLHDPVMRIMALQFIKELGEAMHSVRLERKMKQGLELVYVIGPPRSERPQEHDFGPEDLKSLSGVIDGFSLMTYDFSGPQNPGPNAPIQWIHSILQLLLGTRNGGDQSLAQKIFVGLNFYGNDFVISGGLGGGPIIGREYISLLEEHRPSLQWEKNSAEHFFLYSDKQNHKHVAFYPSLKSIAMRLEEARSWGAGISIWEIGQGLDYFFDIL